MSTLNAIHDIVSDPHRFAREWKERTGGKVLGYLCSNMPEELASAAGILPVRLLGSNEPENITGSYIFRAGFCSFARDCFAQALQGRYDYVDGIAFSQCCPHAREVYNNWDRHIQSSSYAYEIYAPMFQQSPHALEYLTSELGEWMNSLEQWTGKKITTENLNEAVETYNVSRRLMQQLYGLLNDEKPRVNIVEVAEVGLAGMLMQKAEFNTLLSAAIDEINARNPETRSGPRLLLLGSVNSDIGLITFMDSLGGRIVMDDYCTGNRYYQYEVQTGIDPLAAIAERLISKVPCPLLDLPKRRRIDHYARLIQEYRIDGAIYTMQRQCDAHGLDYPTIDKFFKENNVPMLKLELDYPTPIGQFRTRIEAFLEMLV